MLKGEGAYGAWRQRASMKMPLSTQRTQFVDRSHYFFRASMSLCSARWLIHGLMSWLTSVGSSRYLP